MDERIYDLERLPDDAWINLVLSERSRRKRKNRVIILGAGTFVELQKGAEEILGDEASAVFYEAGIRSGNDAAKNILAEWEERGKDLLKRASSLMQWIGWLKVEAMDVDLEKIEGYMRVRESFIPRTYGPSKKTVCHFICGFISGFMSEILREPVTVEETRCEARGDPYCEFQFRKY